MINILDVQKACGMQHSHTQHDMTVIYIVLYDMDYMIYDSSNNHMVYNIAFDINQASKSVDLHIISSVHSSVPILP